jgi:hypothetical protein
MNPEDVIAYVKATARVMDLPLAHDQAVRVADHLGRTVQMARLLESVPLNADDEISEIFVPAPFPSEEQA